MGFKLRIPLSNATCASYVIFLYYVNSHRVSSGEDKDIL